MNDYDDLIAQSRQDAAAQSARLGFSIAADTNPDAYAEARRVAKRTGVPVDTVINMPGEMNRQDAVGSIDFGALARTAPATAGLLADIDRAKIAHDNVDNMTGIEAAIYNLGKFTVGTVGAIASAVPKFNEGAWGVARAGAELLPDFVGRPLAQTFARMGASQREMAAGMVPTAESLLGNSWYSGMQSFGLNALLFPAALAGGAVPVLTGMGLTQAGQSYGEARDKGIGVAQALGFAASQGVIEAGTEMIGMPALFSILKPGKLGRKSLEYLVKDQGGEQIATHLQDLNEWATLNPDRTFSDYLVERPAAALQTALSTAFAGGGQVAAMKGLEVIARRNDLRVQQADSSAELLARLNQLAAADKVLARDPGTFEQFVASAAENGPVQQVFIDANALMQSGAAEQVAAVSPAVAAQLPAALQTGGQIAIPVEEYAARIAPTDAAQGLLEHLRTEPEGFSRAEAQAYMQNHAEELQAEVERVLAEKEGDDAFKQSADAVRAAVKTQLDTAGRFTPQVNEAYSSMVGSFYAVQAARLGITPEELFKRYPLKIGAESVAGGAVFAQNGGMPDKSTASGQDNAPAPEANIGEATILRDVIGEYDPRASISGFGKKPGSYAEPEYYLVASTAFPRKKFSSFDDAVSWAQASGFDVDIKKDGFGYYTAMLTHKATAGALREAQDKFAEKWRDAKHVYLRYGNLPSDGRSTNFADGSKENGVSVFHGLYLEKTGEAKAIPSSNQEKVSSIALLSRPLYVVEGEEVGIGADGEPVLANAKISSEVKSNEPSASAGSDVLNQQARGSFNPATNTITLLKNADLSTFLHESGHFFLEVQADMASRADAPESIRQDTRTLLDWFGVKSLDEWNALSLDAKRPYHEQFARGFEAYLFEGKAPSIELQGLFQRFRAWLLNVYKSLKALNVELTPEVRGVFDRILATGEQIALAEQGRSMMPLFATAEQAGMTPEEFSAYQALGTDATNDAIQDLQARGLRDMQWLHTARGRIVKQLQKEAETRRADVRRQVAEEVNAQPVYRAWQFLAGKEVDGGEPVGKLSRKALDEMYGGAEDGKRDKYALLDWKRLADLRMTADEGEHPDMVADRFGFSSGDELVRKLLSAEKPGVEIEALTDVRMLEQYGDLNSPEAIEKAADRAIHNDARARFVATEANALAQATGQRKVLASAAREYARAMVARLKVRGIRTGQYASAEARAAKAAEKASRAGDLATAAAEKRNQLIQQYATRAAYDAQEEIDRGLRYLKKFEGEIKSLDAGYAEQIGNLLERFDLRKGQSNKAIDKRTALAEWLRSQREAGFEPDIPSDLENEAFRTSYKNMTVEEFRGLVDTVRQIEHLGRLKHKLLTSAGQRDYEAVRDEIAGSIRDHSQGREADTRTPATNMGRAVQGLKRFWAAHIKAATWARIMDGGKDGGPVWEYFVRAANERGDMETTMRAEATAKLSEILAPVFKLGKMGGAGQYFPTIRRSLNREARLAIALNIGNEGNLQRLLGGEGWTVQQILPILQTLTPQEWAAVQAVWDHFESYRPQIASKERRVYGKEPDWVMPGSALTAQFGVRGGYYPIKYDPAASQRAEEHTDAESAKRQLQGAYTTATTRRSFTKARAEEVSGRPLLYTLSGLYSGVNDVIHDLAWHEWLIDTNRLLRSHTIDAAIREHYGPEVKQQFKTWAADIAEGEKGADAAVDLALSRLRQGISASGLGFNVMSAIMQPLGITQSITRVGAPWIGRGVAKYLAGPIDLTRQVNEMSDFMANRARTRFRELNELRNQVQDQSAFREVTGRYAYFLMMRCQQMVDVPTWWGAYEKAVGEGNDERRAAALADQAVIDAQGGGQTKDLAAIERGGPAQKLFTVFYSFMNTALNIGVEKTMGADTPAKRAKLAVDYAMLYVVPAVLGYFLKAAVTPGDSGDDDPENIAKKLLANQLDYLMGLMVVVREFGEAAKTMSGANDMGRDYTGPAGLRLIADAGRFATQAHQGEFDDAFRKAAVNVVGDLFGLPSAQINRTITGAKALAEGETSNPASIIFGFQQLR